MQQFANYALKINVEQPLTRILEHKHLNEFGLRLNRLGTTILEKTLRHI